MGDPGGFIDLAVTPTEQDALIGELCQCGAGAEADRHSNCKRGDQDWLNFVNTALHEAMTGVEFDTYSKSFKTWFGKDLPPPAIGFPVEFERSSPIPLTCVDELGEHTNEVLSMLGFTQDEIILMHERNLVTSWLPRFLPSRRRG